MLNVDNISETSKDLFAEENLRAEELIAARDLPGAAKQLVEIVELDPVNYRSYNNLGIIAWMRKSWEDAFGMFKKAIEIKPDYSDGLINLFDVALKLHRVADIEPIFKKARSLRPDDDELSVIHESIQKEGNDIYLSERGLRIGSYDPQIEEAQALLEEGKLREALTKYLNIVDNKGPSADAFSGLGIISYYQHRYKDSFLLFIESIKLNPTSKENFLNLLDAAKACGKVQEAKEFFNLYRNGFPFLREIEKEFEAHDGG